MVSIKIASLSGYVGDIWQQDPAEAVLGGLGCPGFVGRLPPHGNLLSHRPAGLGYVRGVGPM